MNGITPDCAPFVFLFLIDDRVSPLEVGRELEQRVVFVGDVLAVDDLLDDFIPPLVIKPGMDHSLLPRRSLTLWAIPRGGKPVGEPRSYPGVGSATGKSYPERERTTLVRLPPSSSTTVRVPPSPCPLEPGCSFLTQPCQFKYNGSSPTLQ